MKRLLLALLILLAPAPAIAREARGVNALKVAPAALDPTKAYLLLKTSRAKSGIFSLEHVLLRIPTQAETDAYMAAKKIAYDKALPGLTKKAKDGKVPTIEEFAFDYDGPENAFNTKNGNFLIDGADMRTLLIEVPAGTYVLYGSSLGSGGLVTCNCLGTVKFEAKPGQITNMGSLYVDKVHKPSPVPHLEDNVGPSMFSYAFIFGQGLVPASAADPVPDLLKAFPVVLAEYHAVGLYREPGAASINRLAPVPGILGYRRGAVIDERTGQPVQ
jgi:hypothetical protein